MNKAFETVLLTTVFTLVTTNQRPNIIFILTDDQDITLGGMTPLQRTKHHLGITFTNAFSTTPICCPSRSSILTGLYLHSHGTINNSLSGGCSNREWQRHFEGNTFGSVLHETGYRTFYGGKYLNKYGTHGSGGVQHVPPGWDWWVGLVGNSVYYNYTLSVNGSGVFRGDREDDYLTDVLKEYSLMFLNDRRSQENPFFMFIAPPSPHEPFTPANRHKGRFKGLKAPRTPNFNIPVNKTKHWLVRSPPKVLSPKAINKIDEIFANRLESLLSVDELVDAIVEKLQDIHVLNNTFILFTSDHGFHLGQFGLPWDKRQPYESDIRIPLLVHGPGFTKTTYDNPVLNIDFAATILDMAGVGVETFGDGKSFLQSINTLRTGRNFLIEYHGEGDEGREGNECNDDPNVKLCHIVADCKCFDARNNTFNCLRRLEENVNDIYCRFKDDESFWEVYDIQNDPYQLENLAGRVRTDVQERILHCCEEKIREKGEVDECFELLTGEGKERVQGHTWRVTIYRLQ